MTEIELTEICCILSTWQILNATLDIKKDAFTKRIIREMDKYERQVYPYL